MVKNTDALRRCLIDVFKPASHTLAHKKLAYCGVILFPPFQRLSCSITFGCCYFNFALAFQILTIFTEHTFFKVFFLVFAIPFHYHFRFRGSNTAQQKHDYLFALLSSFPFLEHSSRRSLSLANVFVLLNLMLFNDYFIPF